MRIHTNTVTYTDLAQSALLAGVYLERDSEHKSKSHKRAFDVILSGSSPRRRNSGAAANRTDDYAATWDEWGIFLGELFRRDPAIKCAYYRDAADFHWQTGGRFRALTRDKQHRVHNWTFSMTLNERGCACGAVTRH
jgi:hypothetical protein